MSEAVTAVVMNIPVFWNVMSCGLLYRYQCFRGTCCLHLQNTLLDFLEEGDKTVFRTICYCVIPEDDSSRYYRPPTKFWCVANSVAGRPVIRWIQQRLSLRSRRDCDFNPLNAELNPMCCLLALLTLRRLMFYIYIYVAPLLDVSRSQTTTQHSR